MLGAVILNYCNYKCTVNCVKSLIKQNTDEIKICIVDNGSANESYSILQREFKTFDNIYVLRCTENLGFAKGNNIGIDFLREKKCEDIFIINSDIYFEDKNVLSTLLKAKGTRIGVISPIVFDKSKNGIGTVFIRKKRGFRIMLSAELMYTILVKSLGLKLEKKKKTNNLNSIFARIKENDIYAFSGCAYILTSEFFKHYNGLFSQTYLYYEEWGLAAYLHLAKLESRVIDAGNVIHIGAASTSEETSIRKSYYERQSAFRIFKMLLFKKV